MCTLITKYNAYGDIANPVIETTFENDYIHILNDLSKWYMHGYLISKLIYSKATTQTKRWKNICLPLIWGPKNYHLLVLTNYYSELYKPITHWSDISVTGNMTKTCDIYIFAIYTSLQPIIFQFIIWHTKT